MALAYNREIGMWLDILGRVQNVCSDKLIEKFSIFSLGCILSLSRSHQFHICCAFDNPIKRMEPGVSAVR